MSVAELGSTGCPDTSAFQGLSAGKTRRAPRAGLGPVSIGDVPGGSVSEVSAPLHAASTSSESERASRVSRRMAEGVRVLQRDGSRRDEDTGGRRAFDAILVTVDLA